MIVEPKHNRFELSAPLDLEQFITEKYKVFNERKGGRTIRVVRDDLLIPRGGTKRRTLEVLMPQIKKGEIVYSATPFGYGQVAIAHACQEFSKSATIFTPKITADQLPANDDDPASNLLYFRQLAESHGANIQEVELGEGETFEKVAKAAGEYAASNPNVRHYMESGFDTPEFKLETAALIKEHMNLLEPVNEVWCVAGSGALSRSLQLVWQDATHHVVRVRTKDSIYGVDCDPGNATVHETDLDFGEFARVKPPFPSSENYDAKVWERVMAEATDGALFWNM